MKTLKSITHIFKNRKYFLMFLSVSIFTGLLYSFFMGLIGIPIIDIQLERMILISNWDIAYIFIFSAFVGLLSALYVHKADSSNVKSNKEVAIGSTGFLAGFITAMCPLCPLTLLTLFGITGTLMFLAPYYGLLKVVSLVVIGAAILLLIKKTECKSCNVGK